MQTFGIADDATIVTASKQRAGLSDVKAGDEVEVTYEQHEAAAVAHPPRPFRFGCLSG